MLVSVPFGKRHVVGLVCEVTTHSDVPPDRLRSVSSICTACPPVSAEWLRLTAFAADYYQRGLGEVALPALPQALRDASRWSRLFAPEERYSLTPEGRTALPDALPARASALRKLAQALAGVGLPACRRRPRASSQSAGEPRRVAGRRLGRTGGDRSRSRSRLSGQPRTQRKRPRSPRSPTSRPPPSKQSATRTASRRSCCTA